MRKWIFCSVALLLGACATAEKYEAVLKTWVGSNESSLISAWGPPDSVYENAGEKYLTYSKSSTGYVPGTAPSYSTRIIGNTAYTTTYGGSPGYAYNQNCKTTFTLLGGIIKSWRYEGNACRSQ